MNNTSVQFLRGSDENILLEPIENGQLLFGLRSDGKAVLYIDMKNSNGTVVRAPVESASNDAVLKLK